MKKQILDYIEYDIVGHCNLNCKGCSHFSNLQNEKEFISIKTYEKDLKRLSELFDTIKRIKILGGEPLLHKDLNEIIKITRKILPETKIDIVTNGLLIIKLDPKILETIKQCNVKLIITIYKNTEKIKKMILANIISSGILYETYEEKNNFRRQLTQNKKLSSFISHGKCSIKNCTGIKNGQLGKCPMSIHMHRFNEKFNTKFPQNESINIHDEKVTAKQIKKLINKPIELCKYCSIEPEMFEWCQKDYKKAKEEDWYVSSTKVSNYKKIIYFFEVVKDKSKNYIKSKIKRWNLWYI